MRSLLLLAVFLGLSGCAHEATAPSDDAQSDLTSSSGPQAAADDEVPPPAMPALPRYNVPVATGELAAWAWYPVEAAGAEVKNGSITFHYPFPKLITGEQQYVRLVGSFAPGQTHVEVTADELGHGTCDLADGVWSCHEELPGLRVDSEQARLNLQAAGLSAQQIAKRLAVTARFSVDPIGIFEMAESAVVYEPDDDGFVDCASPYGESGDDDD